MRREVTVDERPGDAGEAEDSAEDPLIPAAIARRHDVVDDRLRRYGESPAAQSLDRAENDQLGHVPAQPTERRADEKENDRALEHAFAPVQIAQLSLER